MEGVLMGKRTLGVTRERMRTDGTATPTSVVIKVTPAGGGAVTESNRAGRVTFDQCRMTTDFVTKGYFDLVKQGKFLNKPYYSAQVASFLPSAGWSYSTDQGVVEIIGGDSFFFAGGANGPWNHPDPRYRRGLVDLPGIKSDAALLDLATIQARSGVVKAESLALVTLAELRKTTQMLQKGAVSMVKAIQAIKSGKPKAAILEILNVPDLKRKRDHWSAPIRGGLKRWLEVRYGWMPLIYDIQGTLKALNAVHKPRYTSRGFANDSTFSVSEDVFNSNDDLYLNYTRTQGLDKRVRAFIIYEVEKQGLLPQQLGLLQLPQVAWELVKFSFVVDWFVDIGSWLDAITPRIGVNILAEGRTVTKQWDHQIEITGATWSPYYQSIHANLSGLIGQQDTFGFHQKVREPGLPAFPLPRINVKLNVKRAVDSVALLAQQVRSLR